VATLLHAIKYPVSTALLDQFQPAWNHAAADSAALLAKEGKTSMYVPVGTAGDNVYRIADDPVAGLTSQVLVGKNGQPLSTKRSPNFINPADPLWPGSTTPERWWPVTSASWTTARSSRLWSTGSRQGRNADRRPVPQWAAE
jgi:hypothetical protein